MQSLLPAPGDVVWIRQTRWRVERARRDHDVVRLDVASDGRCLTFLAPFDRPAIVARRERPRRASPARALARLAMLARSAHGVRSLTSAADARAEILPHQLEPALAIIHGARRVLIADDVGLGKTIQAGLIIAEILRRRPAAHVLVIVPATLRRQWSDELRDRFRIDVAAADAEAIDRLARTGARSDNPWRRPGVWLTSLDYLKQPHVFDALPARPWDLLVVDEAHAVCGDSARHDTCDALARRARGVLLLTATPHDGDETRFARLVEIGRLRGPDDPITVFRRTRADLGLPLERRVRWHGVRLSDAEQRLFDVLAVFEQAVLRAAGANRRDAALLLLSVFRKRALSTMGALVTSLARRLRWLGDRDGGNDDTEWLQPRLDFCDHSDLATDDERSALMGDVGLDMAHERSWLRRLLRLAEAAEQHESKVARLVQLVSRSTEPVAVFTEFRHSLETLRRPLERLRTVAILHGGQTQAERQLALDRFLGGSASLLLATDVASQGLNLQSRARWVISLELPWDPARLEQRAGRVDRLGQTRSVHVTSLVARHDAEGGMLARLARRTLSARRTFGDDILRAAAPDGARLRACLLMNAPLDGLPPPICRVTLCRAWTRAARTTARRLIWRRLLVRPLAPGPRHWRAGDSSATGAAMTHEPGARPLWTTTTRLPRLRLGTDGALLIFSVPIVDGSGAVIEEHLVAVRPPEPGATFADVRPHVEEARRAAAAHLAPRVSRVRRWLRGELERAAARELAIGEALIAARCPEAAQAGLFDRREARRIEGAWREAGELRKETARRVRDLDERTAVEVGRPALELIFTPRW